MTPHPNPTGPHIFPLGALVEVDIEVYDDTRHGSEVNLKGRCNLFVVGHGWDCDGTPLYRLGSHPVVMPETGPFSQERIVYEAFSTYCTKGGGYSARSLKDTGRRVKLYDTMAGLFGI